MKMLVAVKAVGDLDEEHDASSDERSVAPESCDWSLNEWDRFSLEVACQVRETAADAEVVVVTVGDRTADEVLLECLALGGDRGIRVWDDGLLGADAFGVARVLAEVFRKEAPDLVLCGVQSSDSAQSATGVALAGLLDLPRVAVVRSLLVEPEGMSVVVGRELEGGVIETLRTPLPALLTIQTGINRPRYANLRAIKHARAKPLAVLSASDLGVESEAITAGCGSELVALRRPDLGGGAQILAGDAGAISAQIADLVKEGLKP